MNKKIILIIFFSAVLVIGAILLFNIRESKKNSAKKVNPQNFKTNIVEKIPSNTLKEYSDESGFAFDIPDNIKIERKENESVYADLILSASDVNGNITFTVSDSKYDQLESWKDNNQGKLTGLLINQTKLGNLTGISFNNKDKITLVAIDQGIEFKMIVDYKDQKKYWESVYNSIIGSFSFITPSASQSTNTEPETSSGEVIFEGEEIVE
ncbi:MAG: hypothetical protein Q7K55_08540 [Candidatus Levybacteria bacterium]|nr:hypothetical protein [Candidatus Levybacteria bacterium]